MRMTTTVAVGKREGMTDWQAAKEAVQLIVASIDLMDSATEESFKRIESALLATDQLVSLCRSVITEYERQRGDLDLHDSPSPTVSGGLLAIKKFLAQNQPLGAGERGVNEVWNSVS